VTAARRRPGKGRLGAAVLLGLSLLATARPAGAATDAEKEAQKLFVEAMKLLTSKQYGEACDKLARSQELDPGMGTQFRLAECYEKLGRAAGAFIQYSAAAETAHAAGKLDREALARRRATALEPKVARLTITVPPAVAALPGLEVTRDGAPLPEKLWGTPQPVEPGDHLVAVRAPGKKPWEGKVWAEASAKHTVAVGALEDVKLAAPPPPPPQSKAPAIALGVVGGVGVVLGAAFMGLRGGKSSTAQSLHDQLVGEKGNCVNGGMAKFTSDCQLLAAATAAGDHLGSGAVASFTIGGAALAGMALYLLWPKLSPARTGLVVAPAVGFGKVGLTAQGAF
jgi:hypothetical protein